MGLILFFVLAIISIVAAIMVISTKSPVSSALFLVLVMCALAGLFVLLGAIFLAALQVIVYAGAIMILFLFVIMLLNLRRDEYGHDPHRIQKYLGFALVVVILIQGILIVNWAMKDFSTTQQALLGAGTPTPSDSLSVPVDYNSADEVAKTLFTKFTYPFEVTSILLLAAIIGAVAIARKTQPTDNNGEED